MTQSIVELPETEEGFIELLNDYNYAYREGIDITPAGREAIGDNVYDALTEAFREQFPDSQWFDKVEEEEEIEGAESVAHQTPMLSTDKAYTIDALKKWVRRINKTAQALNISTGALTLRITPKLDGLAGKDEDGIFSTRGNGVKGSKINYAFERGVVPIGGRHQGLGEIIIQQSYFEQHLQEQFAHPRNVAVGIIKADTLKDHSSQALNDGAVHFVPYSQLPNWEGDPDTMVNDIESICESLQIKTDYLIDGFVIEAKDESIKNEMGATEHHYRWQIALKKKGEVAYPHIVDETIQIGRTGVATPVFTVEPTLLSGAIIRRVTAHNMRFVRENNIGIGSQIEMVRSGEVIPKIERVLKKAQQPCMFSHCPSCSTPLVSDDNDVALLCPNKDDCRDQVIGQLLHFFTTIDNCDGFGRKTIEALYDNNIKSLKSLYSLSSEDFENMGFGKGISANLEKALENSRRKKVEDWRLLAAFGIRNLGRGDSKKLLKHFSIEALNQVTQQDIINIEGFGAKTSESIANEIQQQWPVISFILSLGFNIEPTEKAIDPSQDDRLFANKNILITGTMVAPENNGVAYKRQELEALIEKLGGKPQKQISASTDILIYGEKAGSKLKKAEQLNEGKGNIEILSEEQFWETYRKSINDYFNKS